MLGTFQQSHIRIQIEAKSSTIRDSLTIISQLRCWLVPQTLSTGLPEKLAVGLIFTSWLGPIPVEHQVEQVEENGIKLLLSQGIDGYHEWHWGDGWVQSDLEGFSLLPINLGQTASLWRLRQFVEAVRD